MFYAASALAALAMPLQHRYVFIVSNDFVCVFLPFFGLHYYHLFYIWVMIVRVYVFVWVCVCDCMWQHYDASKAKIVLPGIVHNVQSLKMLQEWKNMRYILPLFWCVACCCCCICWCFVDIFFDAACFISFYFYSFSFFCLLFANRMVALNLR